MIVRAEKGTNIFIDRKIKLSVIDKPIKNGWTFGSSIDVIYNNGHKIEWNCGVWWWYKFNEKNGCLTSLLSRA